MSEVYAVIWSVPYEGENLMGVFSDYVKARRYVLDQKDENLEIRKLELNKVYEDMFIVGETV
jgi:hypothetical protein